MTVSGLGPRDVHVWSTVAAPDREVAIRSVLARYLGVAPESVPIGRDPNGRRIVETPGLSLSVSRSGDALLVAVAAGQPVGVDVERLRAGPWDLLPRHALTSRELTALEGTEGIERDRTFLLFWTRKEALLKAAGVGLAVDPREIEVSAPGEPARVLRVPAQFGLAGDWSVRDIELPGVVAAIAVAGSAPRVRVLEAVGAPLTES